MPKPIPSGLTPGGFDAADWLGAGGGAPAPASTGGPGWGASGGLADTIASSMDRAQTPARPAQVVGGGTLGAPSRAETEQAGFRDRFRQAGQGEMGARSIGRRQNFQMGDQNTQNQYAQQFNQQIGQDPGLGAYYDRAQERATTGINAQLASRGAYGSSRGLGVLGDTIGGLEAQRAKEEADYMLNQQALGGQLANQAGQSQLGWTQSLGGLGLSADAMGLGRMQGGMSAAQAADVGMLGRTGMAYNQLAGLTGMGTGLYGNAYQNQMAGDERFLDASLTGQMGSAALQTDVALGVDEQEAAWLGKAGQVASSVMGGM